MEADIENGEGVVSDGYLDAFICSNDRLQCFSKNLVINLTTTKHREQAVTQSQAGHKMTLQNVSSSNHVSDVKSRLP
jgi:hypothetical protein